MQNSGVRSDRRLGHFRLIDYQYARDEKAEFHRDDFPKLSIVVKGQLNETGLGRDHWASPLSLVIKPPDAIHANQFGPQGTRIISIISNERNAWPAHLDQPLLNRYRWFHGLSTVGAVTDFLAVFQNIETDAGLEEALLHLVSGLHTDQRIVKSDLPPKWLREVAEQLEDLCDQHLQIRQLAESSGVHPVYLARVFRQYFQCNPKQYQYLFRLRRAIDQLTREEKLVHIALDNGFVDQSHFSRLFKNTTGLSPGNFRKLMQGI